MERRTGERTCPDTVTRALAGGAAAAESDPCILPPASGMNLRKCNRIVGLPGSASSPDSVSFGTRSHVLPGCGLFPGTAPFPP